MTAHHSPKKTRDLEIDEDLDFQRREWHGQRIGTAVLFLFVVGAILGLTGKGGPLSHARAGAPGDAINIEYDRFVRGDAPSRLFVHLRGGSEPLQFWLSDHYLERVKVETITPEPHRISVEKNRHVYGFQQGLSEVTVILHLEALTTGILDGQVGLVGGPEVRFRQFAIF